MVLKSPLFFRISPNGGYYKGSCCRLRRWLDNGICCFAACCNHDRAILRKQEEFPRLFSNHPFFVDIPGKISGHRDGDYEERGDPVSDVRRQVPLAQGYPQAGRGPQA